MKCKKCGKPLNPVATMMGQICGDCTRKAHAKATGKKSKTSKRR